MEAITNTFEIDWRTFIFTLFAILFCLKQSFELIGYFKNRYKIKTGADVRKENIENRIVKLEKHDNWQYSEILKISKGIEDIKKQLFLEDIENKRKAILDFCASLSSGQKQNQEAFDYIFKTHMKYEKILEENHMENNVINESMKFISDKYQEFLREKSAN